MASAFTFLVARPSSWCHLSTFFFSFAVFLKCKLLLKKELEGKSTYTEAPNAFPNLAGSMNLHKTPAGSVFSLSGLCLRGDICHFSVGITELGGEQKKRENLNSDSLY